MLFGDLGMDVFCEETGCSNQSDGGENYEPSIMKYQSNSEQVMRTLYANKISIQTKACFSLQCCLFR